MVFPVTRQVSFYELLTNARQKWLIDALRVVVGQVNPGDLRQQLGDYVPMDSQRLLAENGIRDEEVFPTPIILEAQPFLLGYYRLLLGVGQKTFYRSGTGMGPLQSMEVGGRVNDRQRSLLPEFCRVMGISLAALIEQIGPVVSARDVRELPLLTLGAQFQGGANVMIGKRATEDVFRAIAAIVDDYKVDQTERTITVTNASNRTVLIGLASDPDVSIREQFGSSLRNKVAIEIKGGTDVANVHNRAGEAEKSHLKARAERFRDFWTIISTRGVQIARLQAGSPTTTSWFDAADVLAQAGPDWEEFKTRIAEAVGIPSR